jgi:cytochrome c oxidase assembly protein subunit 15
VVRIRPDADESSLLGLDLTLPTAPEPIPVPAPAKLRRLAWLTFATIFLQLIVGATMRHLQAGLAIPTFPAAAPDGVWWPRAHNIFVDTNFLHTRVGAIIVTLHILALSIRTFLYAKGEPRLVRPAATLLALVAVQITLGVVVILHLKPPTLTTFHVLNGAIILATSLLLALRLRRIGPASAPSVLSATPTFSTSVSA